MSKSEVVFALYHIYDRVVDGIVDRDCKRIGFFETEKHCADLIAEFKNYPGFKEYPETCFKIFEYEVGREYWRDDFLT